jgi:GTPase SAR1 family protein
MYNNLENNVQPEANYIHSFKVILVGESGVGKTSLLSK